MPFFNRQQSGWLFGQLKFCVRPTFDWCASNTSIDPNGCGNSFSRDKMHPDWPIDDLLLCKVKPASISESATKQLILMNEQRAEEWKGAHTVTSINWHNRSNDWFNDISLLMKCSQRTVSASGEQRKCRGSFLYSRNKKRKKRKEWQ